MVLLEAKSLRKAVVPSTLIDNPSPGNLQSTRLALHVNEDGSSFLVYIASGCHVYKIQIGVEDSFVSEGKEGLLIPEYTQVLDSALLDRCPHRSEIQSIALAGTNSAGYLVLGSVDSFGHLIVSKQDTCGKDCFVLLLALVLLASLLSCRKACEESILASDCEAPILDRRAASSCLAWQICRVQLLCVLKYISIIYVPGGFFVISIADFGHCTGKMSYQCALLKFSDVDRHTYSVLPPDSGVGEGSWTGLCFSPSQWSMAAVANSFCKSIDVYDQDIHLRTLRTLWYPSSLNFVQNLSHGNENSILAVTEGCQLTIWDLRMKEKGGCLQRIYGSIGDNLYTVCSSSTGNIAVGGADRTVTIYDPRRWSALSRWVHCSKYEITGLAYSSIDPDYIYVQGVDYEVFCGQWRESVKVFSFRGDSNWLGFSKSSDRDVLGGWSDSGSIFVADVVAKETH
ncbi:hypothetical protein EZV62_022469 [Acer yangbiense]|uniref:Uncharacterized protein n=1 Tax=Acer yangbiense TaxID=1000413 RepID=A0A5C7H8G2_9ROSI|nr:hypothetical protein EZV62_022469 [Acer yangbiense]